MSKNKGDMTEDLLTPIQAAAVAGVSRFTIWKWRTSGKLPQQHIAGQPFVKREDVQRLIEERSTKRT